MKLKFSWLKSRKSLIYSTSIDCLLYGLIFFSIFQNSISDNYILFLLTLLNTFIWIISSYIIGRYTNFKAQN